eukprot:TRINITY_DN2986_c0_g1_i1.p1 TRINITY_DN2986_c0_g1~~TRINITY_DN2986_c0_g1_i1.p1  ORF type:complete len:453 (+),score=53.28 TRINITY_DN2986_c0_g1_i1:422-1780(+)
MEKLTILLPDKLDGKRGSILVSFGYTSGTTLVNKTIIPKVSDHVGSHLRSGTLSVQISLCAPVPLGKLCCHVSTNTSQFLRTSFSPKSTEYGWDPLVFGTYSICPLTNIDVKLRNKKKTKLIKKVRLTVSSSLVDGDVFTQCLEQNDHHFRFVIKYIQHKEPEYSPKNITESYMNLVKDCPTVTPEVLKEFHTNYPLAKNYHYHFVRGLFSSHYPGYFSKNVKRVKQLQLDCTESRANTDKGVEENASFLRTEITDLYTENSKRVILIGHSKGGVDVCAALQLYEDVRSMVAGVITLQSPWSGAPIVDWILSAESRKTLCKTMNNILFCGDQTAYMDLMVKNRMDFNTAHPFPEEIPVVCLSTWTTFDKKKNSCVSEFASSKLTWIARKTERCFGFKSDGLVVPLNAIIPGGDVIFLDGMDHFEASIEFSGTRNPIAPMTQATISLLLEKIV